MASEFADFLSQCSATEPYLEILRQPPKRGYRFRYESEGKTHGVIGSCNKSGSKQFPTVQIQNYQGPAKIIISVVTDADPAFLHPHVLNVNKSNVPGYYMVDMVSPQLQAFSTMSILHVRLESLTSAIEERAIQQCQLDSCLEVLERYSLHGWADMDAAEKAYLKLIMQSLDENKIPQFNLSLVQLEQVSKEVSSRKQRVNMKSVRLCFQAILQDSNKQFTKVLPKVYSDSIIDAKTSDGAVLKISKLSKISSKAQGGQEVIILSDKLSKDDIRVRFFQEENGNLIWEDFGLFAKNDVHKSVAIIMRTPPYRDQHLTHDVTVQMQLQRVKDLDCVSAPMNFTYKATDFDPYKLSAKRRKITLHEEDSELQAMNFADTAVLPLHSSANCATNFMGQDLLGQVFNLQPVHDEAYENAGLSEFASRSEVSEFLQASGLNFSVEQCSDELFASRPAQ